MSEVFDPPLTQKDRLRIAVTGHRRNRLSAEDCEKAETELAKVFASLSASSEGPNTVVSGLADGADLAAARACPEGWKIVGILASPIREWHENLTGISKQDATTFAALKETATLEIVPGPEKNYTEVGHRILNGADCLIAVWNRQPGLPGGTADVVRMAANMGVPTAVIDLP